MSDSSSDSASSSTSQYSYEDDESSNNNDVADVPFDVLLASKLSGDVNKRQPSHKTKRQRTENEDGDDDDDETTKQSKKRKREKKDKSRPVEMSATRPVTKFRVVVPPKPKMRTRDPRFDTLTGELNIGLAQASYSFVEGLEQNEIDDLRKAVKRERNPAVKRQLAVQLQKMNQKVEIRSRQQRLRAKKRELERVEAEKVASGKRPYYFKSSVFRDAALADEFKDLQKQGRVKKVTTNRARRAAAKARKHMPKRRPTEGNE